MGRIGDSNIIPFNFIRDVEIIERIVLSKLKHIQKGVNARYNINLLFEDEMEFIKYVFGDDLTITSGRTVLNKINDALLDTLAVWMFNNKPELDQYKGMNVGIMASVATGELTFSFVMVETPVEEQEQTSIAVEEVEEIEEVSPKAKKKKKGSGRKKNEVYEESIIDDDDVDIDSDDDYNAPTITVRGSGEYVEEMAPEFVGQDGEDDEYIDNPEDLLPTPPTDDEDDEDPDEFFF